MNRKGFVILALLFSIILLLATGVSAGQFVDVPTDHWDGVNWYIDNLYSEGFIEGYPDDTFKRDRPMTRYELAMIVCRINDRVISELEIADPELGSYYKTMIPVSQGIYFSDVSLGHWASYAVAVCDLNGYIVGNECGRFNGDAPVTALQFAIVMDRLGSRLDLLRLPNSGYRDSSETDTETDIEGLHLGVFGSDVLRYLESLQEFQNVPRELILTMPVSRDGIALTIPRVWARMVSYIMD